MELIYRGVRYAYDATRARTGNIGYPTRSTPIQSSYTLRYRGETIQVCPGQLFPAKDHQLTHYNLIYRGVTYHVKRDRAETWITAEPFLY
jgi:Domain of unknown function (DUF4278)